MTAIPTPVPPLSFKAGDYVRATKLAGKPGATLEVNGKWEGTLWHDLIVGKGIFIDQPGTDFLYTTEVATIEPHDTFVYALTANSTYRIERCESFIDVFNRAIKGEEDHA